MLFTVDDWAVLPLVYPTDYRRAIVVELYG